MKPTCGCAEKSVKGAMWFCAECLSAEFDEPTPAATRPPSEYLNAAPGGQLKCVCDFHAVIMRTGCQCGGA